LQLLIGTGLFTSEGNFWRKQRRLAQPAFHRNRFAIMEMQLIVSEFVRRFDFELINKKDSTLKPVSTLRSKEAIEMRVKMR